MPDILTYEELESENFELKKRIALLETSATQKDESYANLIENSPVGILFIKDGKVLDINVKGLNIFQALSKNCIVGKPILDFVHPDFRDTAGSRLRLLTQNTKLSVEAIEEKLLTCAGTEIDVLIAGQRSFFRGEIVVQGYIIDISEQIQARTINEIFRLLFDSAPDGIFITDDKGIILDCNNEFCKQLKLSKEDITGQHTASFVRENNLFEKAVTELKLNSSTQSIVTQIASDKTERPSWRKVSALFDKKGTMTHALVFSRDIGEIMEARRELQEISEEIQRQNEDINASNEELRALNEELTASNDALRESYAYNERIIGELKTSEKKFRMIAETASEFMLTFTVGTHPRISYISPSVDRMGYKHEALFNRKLYDLLNFDETAQIQDLIREYAGQYDDSPEDHAPMSRKIMLNIPDNDGKVHILEGTVSIFSNFGLLIAADITERIENESIKKLHEMAMRESRDKLLELNKKLTKSEESYRNIYNSATEGFFIHEIETGQVIDVNQAVCNMFKFEKDELPELRWECLCEGIPPYTHKEHMQFLLKTKLEGEQHFLWRSRRKDDSLFWSDVKLKLVTIAGIERILAVVRDVDKEEEARKQLEESEEKFRQLSETSPSAIFIYQDNKFVHVNPSTVSMTGFSEEELLGMHFWEVVHPDMREMVKSMGIQRLQGDDIPSRYEMKLLTKTGEEKWIDFNASRVIFRGKPAAIGNVIDITKTKNTVRELIRAKEKAEEADRLKSAFLANMSHEIRTPLNGILGFSQLLSDDDIEEEQKKRYIEIINKSGEQLLTIINDILDVSKIEVGQLNIIFEKYSINAIIDDVFLMFNEKAKMDKKNFSFEKALPDEQSLFFTDDVRLKQILINLINNALKFTEKGFVQYGYKIKGKYLEFFVKDSGIGVPKDKQELIFDRFRQTNETMTRDFGGTGLGLSICKGIVELMNGEIWVESDGKTGSCFKFKIPALKNHPGTKKT